MIREASISDAAEIALVHVQSWQATYRGKFPQAFLDNLDPNQRRDGWSRYFSTQRRCHEAVLVSEFKEKIVGFVNIGPSRDADAKVSEGEVRAIYLSPKFCGQGLGRELMSASLDALLRFGYTEATLWVLGDNERARRFYEAGGWVHDGATKSDDRFGFAVSEVRYRRSLLHPASNP